MSDARGRLARVAAPPGNTPLGHNPRCRPNGPPRARANYFFAGAGAAAGALPFSSSVFATLT